MSGDCGNKRLDVSSKTKADTSIIHINHLPFSFHLTSLIHLFLTNQPPSLVHSLSFRVDLPSLQPLNRRFSTRTGITAVSYFRPRRTSGEYSFGLYYQFKIGHRPSKEQTVLMAITFTYFDRLPVELQRQYERMLSVHQVHVSSYTRC